MTVSYYATYLMTFTVSYATYLVTCKSTYICKIRVGRIVLILITVKIWTDKIIYNLMHSSLSSQTCNKTRIDKSDL